MRNLILSIICIFSFSANAALFVSLSLSDDTQVDGEVIEIYKDRWFYEGESSLTETYVLLFNNSNNQAKFTFKNVKEISHVEFLKSGNSDYKKYLTKNGIIFKNKLVKRADVLTGNEGHHKFEKMFGNFAWDIGILNRKGKQFKRDGVELRDYYIYNKKVYAPMSGVVVGKVNLEEDNVPSPNFVGDLSSKKNNYLTIKVKDQIYLSIVHFKKDSIKVNIGDKVKAGEVLGRVGNSGVSYIPHLHYTMYLYVPSHDRFISVPGFFEK